MRSAPLFIRVEGFNTPPLGALKKGIKPRIQIPYKNNIPRRSRLGMLIVCILFLISCGVERKTRFPVFGTEAALLAKDRAAVEGIIDFSKPAKFEYRFDDSFTVPPDSSLQIVYEFNFPPAENGKYELALNNGTASWPLPTDGDFVFYYHIPIDDSFNGRFSVELQTSGKIDKNASPSLKINYINFDRRFFGFHNSGNGAGKRQLFSSPFVYRQEAPLGKASFMIEVPGSYWPSKSFAGVTAAFAGSAELEFSGRRFETFPETKRIGFAPALYSAEGKAILTGEEIESFYLTARSERPAFPEPITADPGLVIQWPKESWRNVKYEVFLWDGFKDRARRVLIFDFADYAVQDRALKRLAFFVEKTGFRGRLAPDHEIADLHGWNAHDYRAEDLARFFDAARKTRFPLLEEELELEKILLSEGIILEERGGIVAGGGAIISITRESPEYLRYMFMAHEGFHGLFFIDDEFREFCRLRWEKFPASAKRFLISWFEFQQYDVKDEYLLVNEFMAHILQQSVSQAADYFGRHLPGRLEDTWRAQTLPLKDEVSGTWPSLAADFTVEARAFSDYVNQRWGLSAGRVWSLRVR